MSALIGLVRSDTQVNSFDQLPATVRAPAGFLSGLAFHESYRLPYIPPLAPQLPSTRRGLCSGILKYEERKVP